MSKDFYIVDIYHIWDVREPKTSSYKTCKIKKNNLLIRNFKSMYFLVTVHVVLSAHWRLVCLSDKVSGPHFLAVSV